MSELSIACLEAKEAHWLQESKLTIIEILLTLLLMSKTEVSRDVRYSKDRNKTRMV